jgi:adenine-specific DNA-methyltransferase
MSIDELRLLAKKYLEDQRYGLHWDKSSVEEEFIEMLGKGALPTLKEVKENSFNTDIEKCADHLLIEGDNYHSLSLLQFTHKEKIDVIYIDPPYNTGNKDFRYNDHFINKEDQYRHSKWLNFMEKRLELAQNLLKETGVIFISIDESELSQLKLLCDKIFGESNLINMLVWSYNNNNLKNAVKSFPNKKEFILLYAKNKSSGYIYNQIRDNQISDSVIKRYGKYADENMEVRLRDIKNDKVYMNRKITSFYKEYGRYPNDDDIVDTLKGNLYRDVLEVNGERSNIFFKKYGVEFNNPKPLDLIKILLGTTTDKNSIILDFFAGSGTTGHSVLDLNKEDGGNRKFILCTNNEINGDNKKKEVKEAQKRVNEIIKGAYKAVEDNDKNMYISLLNEKEELENKYGVCSTVTYPRLKIVMTRDDYNLGGNLKYLKCEFIPFKKDIEDMAYDYVMNGNIIDIVKVRENVFKEVLKTDGFEVYENDEKIVAIQSNNEYAFESKEVNKLIRDSNKYDKKMYVFSETNNINDVVVFYNIEGVQLAIVPRNLLDILYNQYSFKNNENETGE